INEQKEDNRNDNLSISSINTPSIFNFKLVRSFKLLNAFTGHSNIVWSIDYSTFDGDQFIYSGSGDKTVRVWDVDNNKQIQSFGHSSFVLCVKFSLYRYYNHSRNVICSSSYDNIIRFWDINYNQLSQVFNGHTGGVIGIEFSSFNSGRYLCSGSFDKTVRLWDVEISKSLYVFNGHEDIVWCIDMSPLQSNNNNNDNKINDIGVIGGSGYTICSGSFDRIIRIWDIETNKQLIIFKGHEAYVNSVKYGSNELLNTVLSGSYDKSVRLWDIRSGQQIQFFNGHTDRVCAVEYSPFVANNIKVGSSSSVICSGSLDNTIRFWDIRSNKNELYVIEGDKEDNGIFCLKFISLKKKENNNGNTNNDIHNLNLCYGSSQGPIRILEISKN
ncbi:WD-40 repeat protein, partial [Reticulomyxa filosa]